MLSIPIILVLGLIAFGMIKWGNHKASGVVVGVLFGLTLAATPAGPPILDGFKTFSNSVIQLFS